MSEFHSSLTSGLNYSWNSGHFRNFMFLIVIENLLTSKSYDFDSRQNSNNFEVFEMWHVKNWRFLNISRTLKLPKIQLNRIFGEFMPPVKDRWFLTHQKCSLFTLSVLCRNCKIERHFRACQNSMNF